MPGSPLRLPGASPAVSLAYPARHAVRLHLVSVEALLCESEPQIDIDLVIPGEQQLHPRLQILGGELAMIISLQESRKLTPFKLEILHIRYGWPRICSSSY